MFQKTVVIIFIAILLLTLVVIGWSLSGSATSAQWPPIIGDCPDYWVDLEGNGSACMNTHNLGTCNLTNSDQLYTSQPNTDSLGNTLTEHEGVSQSQCKNLCSGSALCFGAAYRNSTQQCTLKTEDVVKAKTQEAPDYTLFLKNNDSKVAGSAMDFTVAPFTGNDGTCSKYNWANKCGIVWDGINSGNDSNPCNNDTTTSD